MTRAPRWFLVGLYSLFALLTATLGMLPSTVVAAPKLFDVSVVELAGRPGHQGFFPIQGQPIQGAQAGVRVRLIGDAIIVNLLFIDASGNLLSTVPMVAPSPTQAVTGTFFADIVVPTQPFTFKVSGVDGSGIPGASPQDCPHLWV